MCRLILAVSLIGLLYVVPASAAGTSGWLVIERTNDKGEPQRKVVRYRPREGDLVFFDDRNPAWMVLFAWAGTGPPLHMGIVVKKSDGTLAVLEAGPDDTVWVTLQELETRLH